MKKNNIKGLDAKIIDTSIPCKNLNVGKRPLEKRLEDFDIYLVEITWSSKGLTKKDAKVVPRGCILKVGKNEYIVPCQTYNELKMEYKQHASEYLFEDLKQVKDKIKGKNKKRFLNTYEHTRGTYNYRLSGENVNRVYIKDVKGLEMMGTE